MSASDSDLSTPPATDDEMPVDLPSKSATKGSQKKKNGLIVNYFAKKDRSPSPPPRKKRAPSPPHEPVPEDNPDIPVCSRRVRRVESRRDRDPTARNDRVEPPLTDVCTPVHSHVSIAIFRSLSSQMPSSGPARRRARRRRRPALLRSRSPSLRPAGPGQQSQEACRVGLHRSTLV